MPFSESGSYIRTHTAHTQLRQAAEAINTPEVWNEDQDAVLIRAGAVPPVPISSLPRKRHLFSLPLLTMREGEGTTPLSVFRVLFLGTSAPARDTSMLHPANEAHSWLKY